MVAPTMIIGGLLGRVFGHTLLSDGSAKGKYNSPGFHMIEKVKAKAGVACGNDSHEEWQRSSAFRLQTEHRWFVEKQSTATMDVSRCQSFDFAS